MFQINDDNSIYVTRGDVLAFSVSAEGTRVSVEEETRTPFNFQAGDVLTMKVYAKKDCADVVFSKDFEVKNAAGQFWIYLPEEDTKIGEVISKPKDYWYEIVLNEKTNPQTIVGYDDDGAKLFKLFPEGADIPETPVKPEDIPVVDTELDMTSNRPVENRAIARAFESLREGYEDVFTAVAEKYVTPQMFGAVGDGVADDTEAFKECFSVGSDVVIPAGTYLITDTVDIANCVRVRGCGEVIIDFAGDTLFNVSTYFREPFELSNVQIKANGNQVIYASNGSWGASFVLENVLITEANDACVEMGGAFNAVFRRVIINGAEDATGTLVQLGTDTNSDHFSNLIYFESCAFFANKNVNLIDVGNARSAKAVNCTFEGFNCSITGSMTLLGCWFEDGNQCVDGDFSGTMMSSHAANVATVRPSEVEGSHLIPNVKGYSLVEYADSANSILKSMYENPVYPLDTLYASGYENGEYRQEPIYKIGTNIAAFNVPINKIWKASTSSWLGFPLTGFAKHYIGIFELKVHYFRVKDDAVVQRGYWHGIVKDGVPIEFNKTETNEDYPSSLEFDSANGYMTYGNANGGTSFGWLEFNRLSN